MNGELTGRRLGRYEVSDLLGVGGMGKVYRGRDTVLGREVAVKVIRHEEGRRRSPSRFEREARLAAQLSHPNIVELHDFGLADDQPYAVMELLEGESLRDRLQSRGLSLNEAVEIGGAIAEGLAAAHDAGVVHRDIKPANVFLTRDDRVKILDFGIAQPAAVAGELDTSAETLTEPGAVVGTTPYMSPEQVRGERVDSRSDIFSLGCVLYEMIVGESPFLRESQAQTFSAILTEEPQTPSNRRKGIPSVIDQIVARCVRKEAGARFDSARDVAFALRAAVGTDAVSGPMRNKGVGSGRRWLRVGAGVVAAVIAAAAGFLLQKSWGPPELPECRRLAVLRFDAPTGDMTLKRMAAGLTENLAWKVALLEREGSGLDWVLDRSESDDRSSGGLPWMRTDRGVNLVLRGRLQDAEGRLRLELELADAATGRVLRRSSVEGARGNPASLQVEPVRAVAEMLGIEAGAVIGDRLREGITNVTRAWPAYLEGSGRLALDGESGWEEGALPMLEAALEADPLFLEARLEIARGCLMSFNASENVSQLERGLSEVAQVTRQRGLSGEAALIAAALYAAAGDDQSRLAALESGARADPDNGQVRLELGLALKLAGRVEEAERELQRAIYLRPGYWLAHHWLAELEVQQGHYDAAVTEFRRVVELVPEYGGGYGALAVPLLYLGRHDEARTALERSLELAPEGNYFAFSNLGSLYFYEARFADAAVMYERALEVEPDDYRVWGNLGWARSSIGDSSSASIAFRRAITLTRERRDAHPEDVGLAVDVAGYFGAIGDEGAGLEVLEAAVGDDLDDPEVVAQVAETFEDLGDRDRALEWVEHALGMGVPPDRFTKHPSLRDLAADPRFGELADADGGSPGDVIATKGGDQ